MSAATSGSGEVNHHQVTMKIGFRLEDEDILSDVLRVLRQPKWLAALPTLPFLMGLCVVAANWQYEVMSVVLRRSKRVLQHRYQRRTPEFGKGP